MCVLIQEKLDLARKLYLPCKQFLDLTNILSCISYLCVIGKKCESRLKIIILLQIFVELYPNFLTTGFFEFLIT